jgi:hypothetical protein
MPPAKASQPPRTPFVEPAFYTGKQETELTLLALIRHLIGAGASLAGEGLLGEEGAADSTADPLYSAIDRVSIRNEKELLSHLEPGGRILVGVTLSGVPVGAAGRDVQVRMLPIAPAAVGQVRHPVAIWCDGAAFEPHASASKRTRAAADVRQLFESVTAALKPDYGAIEFAWPLPTPFDVAQQPDGFEFKDFYLSRDYLDPTAFTQVASAIDDEHRQPVAHGELFLTSGVFAPPPVRDDGAGTIAARAIAARFWADAT